jgi:hypothetical protein
MSGTFDLATRYRARAEECLKSIAPSETPGTRETQRLIANYYVLLAEIEKWKLAPTHIRQRSGYGL